MFSPSFGNYYLLNTWTVRHCIRYFALLINLTFLTILWNGNYYFPQWVDKEFEARLLTYWKSGWTGILAMAPIFLTFRNGFLWTMACRYERVKGFLFVFIEDSNGTKSFSWMLMYITRKSVTVSFFIWGVTASLLFFNFQKVINLRCIECGKWD